MKTGSVNTEAITTIDPIVTSVTRSTIKNGTVMIRTLTRIAIEIKKGSIAIAAVVVLARKKTGDIISSMIVLNVEMSEIRIKAAGDTINTLRSLTMI